MTATLLTIVAALVICIICMNKKFKRLEKKHLDMIAEKDAIIKNRTDTMNKLQAKIPVEKVEIEATEINPNFHYFGMDRGF